MRAACIFSTTVCSAMRPEGSDTRRSRNGRIAPGAPEHGPAGGPAGLAGTDPTGRKRHPVAPNHTSAHTTREFMGGSPCHAGDATRQAKAPATTAGSLTPIADDRIEAGRLTPRV